MVLTRDQLWRELLESPLAVHVQDRPRTAIHDWFGSDGAWYYRIHFMDGMLRRAELEWLMTRSDFSHVSNHFGLSVFLIR